MRRLNAALVRWQVALLARRLRLDLRTSVVFATIPTAWEVLRRQVVGRLVFNRSDLHSAFEETDQQYIRALERALLTRSDAVVYASHALMAAERTLTGDRAQFVDHGVDLQHFGGDVEGEPVDLRRIARPRIGFFGGLDDYVVDFELLEHVAREIPEASLVLIGDATCSMDRFDDIPNVHWLGFRAYDEIPAYGSGFDVALMPWLRNEWIEHSNPIKLKEYLALGLPVVSTDFPEVRYYDDVIAIASDPTSFVELIREALDGRPVSTPELRRARVATSTWDERAEQLRAIAEDSA